MKLNMYLPCDAPFPFQVFKYPTEIKTYGSRLVHKLL